MTLREICTELRVFRTTIINAINRQELTATRVGNVYRVRRADLEEYVRARTSFRRAS
jgi:excisionase family DNA binding protein